MNLNWSSLIGGNVQLLETEVLVLDQVPTVQLLAKTLS